MVNAEKQCNRTEQVRIRNKDVDDRLGHSWITIHDEVVRLHATWKLYSQLFRSGEENILILNKVAGITFKIIQATFYDDIVLTISRLTDRAQFGKLQNISLRHLLTFLDAAEENSNITQKLTNMLQGLDIEVAIFKNYRNKALGHLDSDMCLEGRPELSNIITYAEIEQVLKGIRDFLWVFEYEAFGNTTSYESVGLSGSGDDLLRVLKTRT
ncbi:hypothetical protein CHISP_3643 [Chitinispirillum alkaliphilum]|nr:hypothetical protein CHISP_3643 [Chitinispirillum alkaliphilum]